MFFCQSIKNQHNQFCEDFIVFVLIHDVFFVKHLLFNKKYIVCTKKYGLQWLLHDHHTYIMSSSQCCSYGDTGGKGCALFWFEKLAAFLQILVFFPLAPSFHFGFEDIETGEAIGLEEKKNKLSFLSKIFQNQYL